MEFGKIEKGVTYPGYTGKWDKYFNGLEEGDSFTVDLKNKNNLDVTRSNMLATWQSWNRRSVNAGNPSLNLRSRMIDDTTIRFWVLKNAKMKDPKKK